MAVWSKRTPHHQLVSYLQALVAQDVEISKRNLVFLPKNSRFPARPNLLFTEC